MANKNFHRYFPTKGNALYWLLLLYLVIGFFYPIIGLLALICMIAPVVDRSNKSVCPTAIGLKILRQAETAVNEAGRINEIVAEEKGSLMRPASFPAVSACRRIFNPIAVGHTLLLERSNIRTSSSFSSF